MTNSTRNSRLSRAIGRYGLLFYGLGNIVGAGIYVLIGAIAARAGYAAPVSFVIASFAALLTAFSYVELTGFFPVAASESVYAFKAFKKRWLSVLIGAALFAAAVVSAATLAVSFAGYFSTFVGWPQQLVILLIVVIMTLIVLAGIKETVRTAVIFTAVEIAGLILIVGSSAVLAENFGSNFAIAVSKIPDTLASNLGLVISGSFLAFYAFIGFEDMVGMAEEVKQPKRNYPFAIIAAISVATLLYILVALTSLSVLTPNELAASKAPLATVFQTATGGSALIISAIGLVAITNGLLAHFVTGSRMLYGMSNQRWLTASLSRTNRHNVPHNGALAIAVLTLICALTMSLSTLAELTSLCLLSVFTIVNLSLIVLRRKKHIPSVGKIRQLIPWLGALVSLIMLVSRLLV